MGKGGAHDLDEHLANPGDDFETKHGQSTEVSVVFSPLHHPVVMDDHDLVLKQPLDLGIPDDFRHLLTNMFLTRPDPGMAIRTHDPVVCLRPS